MPDKITSPSPGTLQGLLSKPLNVPIQMDDETRNRIVQEQQKQVLQQRSVASPTDKFIQGLLSGPAALLLQSPILDALTHSKADIPRDSNEHDLYNVGQDIGGAAGQELAGIPFPAGQKVYHGSPRASKIVREGFNMKMNDPHDTMGWMIHAAEEPDYAESYANGMKTSDTMGENPGILPLTSNAKNMFDAFNPTSEDIARLFSVVGPYKKTDIKDAWKRGQVSVNRGDPLRGILNYIKPHEFEKTGFDAVKYNDAGRTSYAFPDPTVTLGAYDKQPIGGQRPDILSKEPVELPGDTLWYPRKQEKKVPITDNSVNSIMDKLGIQSPVNKNISTTKGMHPDVLTGSAAWTKTWNHNGKQYQGTAFSKDASHVQYFNPTTGEIYLTTPMGELTNTSFLNYAKNMLTPEQHENYDYETVKELPSTDSVKVAPSNPTTNKFSSQDTINVTNIADKLGINYHKFNMPDLINHLLGQHGALSNNEFNYLYDLQHPSIGTPTKLEGVK